MSRNEWPRLRAAAVLGASVLIFALVVAGVLRGDSLVVALLDGLCAGADCPGAGLVVSGWAVLGGPILLAGLIVLLSSPGATAQHAMLACVCLLAFGAAALYSGLDDLGGGYPGVRPLGIGFYAAIFALILGATIAGPADTRPRYSSTTRLPSAAVPLLVVGVCQVLALAVAVVLWATVFG